jgi:hypothetical protein
MKILSFLLVGALFFSCAHSQRGDSAKEKGSVAYIRTLKKRKAFIDKILTKDTDKLDVFVKITDKTELIRIIDGKFPEDSIECTYNIFKDKGKVIAVLSSPFSESGDWDWSATHYFDKDGKTFAFEIQANAFVLPNDGVAYETTTDYFNAGFKRIKHIYTLVDENKKALDKQYAFDREGFDNRIYPTVDDCLKAYHIKLPNK